MSERNRAKSYRLRRTLPKRPNLTTTPPMPRTSWGLSLASAEQMLRDQEAQFRAEWETVEEQRVAQRTEHKRLLQESERYRRRLISLRGVVEVLRNKLAQERAARSVLAARLIDRQADQMRAIDISRLDELRLEKIRTSAEIYQEHESLKSLVRAIYRSVAGRDSIPTDLEVVDEFPLPPPAEAVDEPLLPQESEWHAFLLGKVVGRDLSPRHGEVIAREGEIITADHIALAAGAGLLFDLILAMRLPITHEDL